MKKRYTALKAFAPCGWEAGKKYDMEESDAQAFVAGGILSAEAADPAADAFDAAVSKAVQAALSGLGFEPGDGSRPPRLRVVQDEADKTKGLGEFLQCVGIVGLQQNVSAPMRDAAHATIQDVYGVRPDPTFAGRYAESAKALYGEGSALYKAALAESSGITGGYTVPTEYAMQLLELSAEGTVLVGETDDYPMSGAELKMPVLDQTTAPTAGNTAYFGGVTATWVGEAATRPETEPKFKEIALKANELAGYALASRNVLFDNKVALEQRLTRLFAGAVGWYRDYAYLRGDGVGKPKGIMNAPATLTVSRATANQVNFADIAQMYGLLTPQSLKTAFWVMQQSVLQSFLQMKDSTNGRFIVQPYYVTAGGPATQRPQMTLLGLPIKTTEKLSTLGTAGDLMLIDPKQYFTGTRRDIEIAASEHYKFLNNQVTFRFLFRGDGQPWMDLPLTLQDTTTQLSPFIKLV